LLDFRAGFLAAARGFDARATFRDGFLATAFAVFLAAGFLEALRALFDAAFGFADRLFVVELFFFGAAFAFRVVRFLAAPIAAPERAPITVPTTGKPSAVPATAPATAPPSALPAVPMPVSVPVSVSTFSLSSMLLSPSLEKDARFCTSRCQHEVDFMHCAKRLRGLTLSRRTIAQCWRGLIAKARNPLVHRFARRRHAHDVLRPTFASDVLWRLAIASVE
jgi:hypothetical protein